MSIISTTERLLIMDLWDSHNFVNTYDLKPNESRSLHKNEMEQIRETGAETVVNFVIWAEMEKKPGEVDWSQTDTILARNRSTGFKTLFMLYDMAAEYFPDDWYLATEGGYKFKGYQTTGWSTLSPWNKDAMAESRKFTRKFMERYAAPDVEFFASFQKEAEQLLPPGARAWFDPAAVKSRAESPEESLAEWVERTMRDYFLEEQSNFPVKWVALHRAFDWTSGNFISRFYPSMDSINEIMWTYWPHPSLHQVINGDISRYNIRAFGGAEWCEGLAVNGPLLKTSPLQGLVVGPIHPYSGHSALESWMLDNMRNFVRGQQ